MSHYFVAGVIDSGSTSSEGLFLASRKPQGSPPLNGLSHLVAFLLIRLLDMGVGFVQRALRVVVRLQGSLILVQCAIALSGNVKDFPQSQMCPHLHPFRIAIARKCSPHL